jgi:protein O-GlcNAc transferase
VRHNPDDPDLQLKLALTNFKRGNLVKAVEAADRVIALGGDVTSAWRMKAAVNLDLGDAPAAATCFRAILRKAGEPKTHSRLLMTMQYCDKVTEAGIFAEVKRWARRMASRIAPRSTWPDVAFDPGRSLAIGIVSSDFQLSPTAFLSWPLFEHWPPDWSVTLYSSVDQPDEWTDRFRRACVNFVDIAGCDDEEAAAKILGDRIDVLIDLKGHTWGGRLGIFARKPAPVQIAWLDYVGTTGLASMDAIIADAGHVPLTEQCWYVEPIRHVRDNLYRYQPPEGAPAVGPLPAAGNGFVTFGCFNNPLKLSEKTVSLWAEILNALPSSRLILNTDRYRFAGTRQRFRRLFAKHALDPKRVDMRPGGPQPIDLMRAYGEIDIALDPFPYSGGLTTIEALYMGVPVVTAPGGRFCSRHASVHLATVGLADWIAADTLSYTDLAVRKARDLKALAALRGGLRARVEDSALRDGAALAEDFARIVRDLWINACRKAGPFG